jgi:hypothetical protein
MTTPTTTSARAFAAELRERGHRAEVFPADPPHTKVDAVNIWYDPHDRNPSDTAWEPCGNDGWEWGPNFEHRAPTEASVAELADRVLATLKPRD